ncbi:hypothetical protein PAXRUDRAFT_36688 [Paxillus rubicundulus Ve08.2h10]|uniref:Fungal-type protein kinase domain-containing protein n=1 Tax=Paxillus rubicundulus Ve08.2h10 TaxID=930991 RepID=A0A0D0DBY0_9AGAM|nr:hypothetical protein PAXRUDRAFT_36688 [Paxillus rubicundulus Ve08.2h10]
MTFMVIEQLYSGKESSASLPPHTPHTVTHDLESFFYILLLICILFKGPLQQCPLETLQNSIHRDWQMPADYRIAAYWKVDDPQGGFEHFNFKVSNSNPVTYEVMLEKMEAILAVAKKADMLMRGPENLSSLSTGLSDADIEAEEDVDATSTEPETTSVLSTTVTQAGEETSDPPLPPIPNAHMKYTPVTYLPLGLQLSLFTPSTDVPRTAPPDSYPHEPSAWESKKCQKENTPSTRTSGCMGRSTKSGTGGRKTSSKNSYLLAFLFSPPCCLMTSLRKSLQISAD